MKRLSQKSHEAQFWALLVLTLSIVIFIGLFYYNLFK